MIGRLRISCISECFISVHLDSMVKGKSLLIYVSLVRSQILVPIENDLGDSTKHSESLETSELSSTLVVIYWLRRGILAVFGINLIRLAYVRQPG